MVRFFCLVLVVFFFLVHDNVYIIYVFIAECYSVFKKTNLLQKAMKALVNGSEGICGQLLINR